MSTLLVPGTVESGDITTLVHKAASCLGVQILQAVFRRKFAILQAIARLCERSGEVMVDWL